MRVIRHAICFTELANIGPVDDNRAALLLRRIQLTEILRASERRGILHRALRLYAYDVGLFFFHARFQARFLAQDESGTRAADNSWRQLGYFPETSFAKFFAKRKYLISADMEGSLSLSLDAFSSFAKLFRLRAKLSCDTEL